jgi:hypothetical protein
VADRVATRELIGSMTSYVGQPDETATVSPGVLLDAFDPNGTEPRNPGRGRGRDRAADLPLSGHRWSVQVESGDPSPQENPGLRPPTYLHVRS